MSDLQFQDVFPLRGQQTVVAIAQSTGVEEIRIDPTEFVRNIVLSYDKKKKQGSSQAVMDIQENSEAVMYMQGSRKSSMDIQESSKADMDMQGCSEADTDMDIQGSSETVMNTSQALKHTSDSDDECDADGDESKNVFNSYILKHHKGDKSTFVRELGNMQRCLGR